MIGRKLDVEKQKAFIDAYENLMNSLGPDVAGCSWAPCIHTCSASCRLLGSGCGNSGRSSKRWGDSG